MSSYRFESLTASTLHDFLGFFDHEAFEPGHKWSGCYCQFYLHDPALGDANSSDAVGNRQRACDRVEAGQMQGFWPDEGDSRWLVCRWRIGAVREYSGR